MELLAVCGVEEEILFCNCLLFISLCRCCCCWRDGAPQKLGLGYTQTENTEQQSRRGEEIGSYHGEMKITEHFQEFDSIYLKIISANVSLTTSDASSVDNIWMRCVYGQMGTGQRHSFESEY